MSTPDDGAPLPERRPVGERRARREEGGATEAEDAPLTRREMKARGMVFTTELPVIPAPLLAEAGEIGGGETERGEREGGEAEAGAPVPARPTVRARLTEPGGGSSRESEPEEPSERTTTGRRPVVRPPTAARAIRRLDETGAISAVQPVVAGPVAAVAPADPLTDPGPTNVAASWESAVSMPAVVLGIRDHAESPTGGARPMPAPRTELVAPPIRPPRRESLRDQAGRGLPGTAGRQGPPEASPGWSALLEEEATSTGTMLARVAASLSEQTSAAEAVPAGRHEVVPDADADADVDDRADAGGNVVPEAHGDVDGRAAGDVVGEAPPPPRASAPEAGRTRRWWPESGALRFALLVAVGVALGLLIVLIANGTLGSVFAAGPGHLPGGPVPGAPPSALLAPTIV